MTHLNERYTARELSRIQAIRIVFEIRNVSLSFSNYTFMRNIFNYQKAGDDTIITLDEEKNEEMTVDGRDYISVMCEDLNEICMKHNQALNTFEVIFDGNNCEEDNQLYLDRASNRFYQFFNELAKQRTKKLKVEHLSLSGQHVNQFMSVLPYLNWEYLKTFGLIIQRNQYPVDFGPIFDMKLWSQSEDPMELFIKMRELSVKSLESLKNGMISNHRLTSMLIKYNVTCDEEHLDTLFGVPDANPDIEWRGYKTRCSELPSKAILKVRTELKPIDITRTMTLSIDSLGRNKTLNEELGNHRDMRHEVQNSPPISVDGDLTLQVFHNRLVLKNIFKSLFFYDIANLRKVSHTIRHNIDRIKPDPRIESISIEFLCLELIRVDYVDHESECSVAYKKQEDWEETRWYTNFGNQLIQEFELNLRHQKECIDTLKLNFTYQISRLNLDDWEMERSVLEMMTTKIVVRLSDVMKRVKLKVRKLYLQIYQPKNIRLMLQHLDRTHLKSIEIQSPYEEINLRDFERRSFFCEPTGNPVFKPRLSVKKFSNSKQWRRAEELRIKTYEISTKIKKLKITHFAIVDILMSTISVEDIVYLKNALLNSPTLKKCKIAFKASTVDGNLYQLMGHPFHMTLQKSIWYFRDPLTGLVLHVVYTVNQSVTFTRVKPEVVPEGALDVGNEDEEEDDH